MFDDESNIEINISPLREENYRGDRPDPKLYPEFSKAGLDIVGKTVTFVNPGEIGVSHSNGKHATWGVKYCSFYILKGDEGITSYHRVPKELRDPNKIIKQEKVDAVKTALGDNIEMIRIYGDESYPLKDEHDKYLNSLNIVKKSERKVESGVASDFSVAYRGSTNTIFVDVFKRDKKPVRRFIAEYRGFSKKTKIV